MCAYNGRGFDITKRKEKLMSISEETKYYKLLAEKWPTKKDVMSEIINLSAILSLPKGTEHFISDIHGEHEHFTHVMRTASGVIRSKIRDVYGDELSVGDQIELANLIYYPEKVLKKHSADRVFIEENLLRLVEICRISSAKYTRSKVRKALPEKYAYIIDELLNCDSKNINKENYYNKIVETIINLGCADDFIEEIACVIRKLSIDHLHIVGDIFDRGPRSDIVLDTLLDVRNIDIQWGNHDVIWMGAMMGSPVCVSVVVANNLKYGNVTFLEEGYGISLRNLEHFADRLYTGKNSIEKMYKAISVIRYKLEDSLMKSEKSYCMSDKTRLDRINFRDMTWCGYKLNTDEFPTVYPDAPFRLSRDEKVIIEGLTHNFKNNEKIKKHLNFMFSKGSIYLCYNGNLLYHGCVPLDDDGEFSAFTFDGKKYSGKTYMDFCEKKLRKAYNDKNAKLANFAWFLWCSPDSPLFGKTNMATFERMYIDDKKAHKEEKQPYFRLWNNEKICDKIMHEFGIDPESGHIINGHIPVRFRSGESPVKAGGKLILIDGGMSTAYRKQTGIAGYTLIYNSYGLAITSHSPFESINSIVDTNCEMVSQKYVVESVGRRRLVSDTDNGKRLLDSVEDLKTLMFLYEAGIIAEKMY